MLRGQLMRRLGTAAAAAPKEISAASVVDSHAANVVPSYGRFNIALSHGEGAYVWDYEGKRYLDFGGGIAVNCLGHAHPAISETLSEQSKRLTHISNLYYNEHQGQLAGNIVRHLGPGKVFFCNSGVEANEGLFKLARRKGDDQSRYGIITALNSFHGRSLTCISATGQDKIKDGFGPQHPDFKHVPFNDLAAMEAAIEDTTVAIHLEGVQGESGIVPAQADYLLALRKLCDERDILLMIDAVQCGHFRTGRYQSYSRILEGVPGGEDFVPDAVSMAKSLGGGFPIGAFWVREPYQDLLSAGKHGTTYGGNPLGCAVANTIFEVIENEGLEAHIRALGDFMTSELRTLQAQCPELIKEVRGYGCMLGVEFQESEAIFPKDKGTPGSQLCGRLHEHGMLTVGAGPNTIRILPPFNISMAEAEEGMGIFGKVARSFS